MLVGEMGKPEGKVRVISSPEESWTRMAMGSCAPL